ncbi:MAG: hypothetical protein ACTSVI_05215 [Promethearchaeota archaeon]
MDIKSDLRMIWQATKRNLQNDWKYKFRLIFNSLYTVINLALFTIIAKVVNPKQGALPDAYGDDSYLKFLFIGTYFWAMFTRPFEDTVNCLPEESQKGTIGLLITNNVGISKILMGRYFASLIISVCLSTAVVMPFLGMLDMLNYQTLLVLPWIFLIWLSCMVFMLCVSLWVASFSLLFKKTGVLSNVFIYGLKVTTGMYFPVFGLGNSALLLGSIPVASGVDLLRDLFITGAPQAHGIPGKITWAFWQFTPEYWVIFVIQTQVIGVLALAAISYFSIKAYTKKAKILGTIEAY